MYKYKFTESGPGFLRLISATAGTKLIIFLSITMENKRTIAKLQGLAISIRLDLQISFPLFHAEQ